VLPKSIASQTAGELNDRMLELVSKIQEFTGIFSKNILDRLITTDLPDKHGICLQTLIEELVSNCDADQVPND
jgi:hypothetical protein